jgi:hypothetical protein
VKKNFAAAASAELLRLAEIQSCPPDIRDIEDAIASGADPDAKSDFGTTALMAAVQSGQRDTVDLLLKQGANPDEVNDFGHTALMHAAMWGRRHIVRRLLAEGANPLLRDEEGCTAASHARAGGFWVIVLALQTAEEEWRRRAPKEAMTQSTFSVGHALRFRNNGETKP